MSLRTHLLFAILSLALVVAFGADLLWGTVPISIRDLWEAFATGDTGSTAGFLLHSFRLPKALTALFAGAGVSIAGLQMQGLFRNPLADTSILGINSGAGVGVAIYTMAYGLFPQTVLLGSGVATWGIIISACIGSFLALLLIFLVASRVRSLISVLIVGVMVGFLSSSVISILQYLSDEETLKTYLLWSFGSVASTTWYQLHWLLPIVSLGLLASLTMPKQMNALALGERYARSVGINVRWVRFALIGITSVLSGCITAFTGPIAFLGLAVPHFVRMAFVTSNHRVLIPATMLSGALLLVLCDICTQMPGRGLLLPINALTSLVGAPVVILIIIRSAQSGDIAS